MSILYYVRVVRGAIAGLSSDLDKKKKEKKTHKNYLKKSGK